MRWFAILVLAAGCPDRTDTTPTTPTTGDTGTDEVFDALSMPAVPTHDPSDFTSAQICGSCHVEHLAEWQTSMHAYAMVDPVFQRLVELRQVDLDGREDRFCMQCHSSIATRGGLIERGFAFADLEPIAMEGITCESCHKVSEVARDYNSGHVLDVAGPVRGPGGPNVGGAPHALEAAPMLQDSEFCGACHDVIETSGLDLERPYREWQESPSAYVGETCQDCHMRRIEREPADGAPVREGSDHRFVGVDLPLIDGWMDEAEVAEMRDDIQALLDQSASLELSAPDTVPPGNTFDVNVTLINRIPGHNLPTGSTFLRQVWLELTARDGEGNVLYVTGDLDANGDLRDHWSALDPYGDHDLVTLSSNFVDGAGAPTLFPWRAAEHTSFALSPLYDRTVTLFVPTVNAADDTVTIEARLRFRPVAPYLLRELGLEEALPKVETYDIAADSVTVSIAP